MLNPDEAEVTPEMLKAGATALMLWDQTSDNPELIVEYVFTAMDKIREK